ncbi:MAG: recombinase family protein [Solirubrobacteraceae bacterium]
MRESTEEQGQGFSPDAQQEAIRKFAAENELTLAREYCDFHSGWRKSEARPQFQALMADAAAGAFDCVLVFHTSRFARSQVEARRYKQLLRERLGIRVVSVTQPMGEDPNDPSAFLAESIHEMFDEYYSVSLSFWTTDEKQGVRGYVSAAVCEDLGHRIGRGPFSRGCRSASVAWFWLERGPTGPICGVFAHAGLTPARLALACRNGRFVGSFVAGVSD